MMVWILIILSEVDSADNHMLGWDATNPYEDSLLSNYSIQLPESSGDTNEMMNNNQFSHDDSIDSIFPFHDKEHFPIQNSGNTITPPVLQDPLMNPSLAPPPNSLSNPLNQYAGDPSLNDSVVRNVPKTSIHLLFS